MMLTPAAKALLAVTVTEAVNLAAVELDIEHLFLGLLKIEDLLSLQDPLIPISEGEWVEALNEIQKMATYWKERGVDCIQARRRLRRILMQSNFERGEFGGHRTPRCRKLFEEAEQIAEQLGSIDLGLIHFLVACLYRESPSLNRLFQELNLERSQLIPHTQVIHEKQELDKGKPPAGGGEIAGGLEKEAAQPEKTSPFARYGRDLTSLARQGKLVPVIGRKEEIKQVARILNQNMRSNPILLGDPGVGKTAIVEGLAQRAVQVHAPESIRNLHIVEVMMGALVAGAVYRGQFEERLMELLRETSQDEDLVLFIDEIHTLIGAGVGSGSLDAANILKPALARGEIRCIGATTVEEYRKHIESDAALARRFQAVWIEEPTQDEALEILRGLRPRLEQHHQLSIADPLLVQAVELSMRYIQDTRLPDKAIMIVDEACSKRKLQSLGASGNQQPAFDLLPEDIIEVVACKTKIPAEVIKASDEERLLNLEAGLRERVIGQEAALASLARLIRSARAGLNTPGRPIVVLFAGPSGTGKTELAKALSEYLYHDEKRLIRLDMSEYHEEHTLAKIIGSPPGYVGFGEEPYLVREIRLHPSSVVLLDEIEKAHMSVLNLFLQVFDEGRMTDAKGRVINFSEAIFILTSNLGSGKAKAGIGFKLGAINLDENIEDSQVIEAQVKNAIRSFIRPELLNRIQDVVVFQPLSRPVIDQIIKKFISQLNQRLREKAIRIMLHSTASDYLVEKGFSIDFGARNLSRIIESEIVTPLARAILEKRVEPTSAAFFRCEKGKLVMELWEERT